MSKRGVTMFKPISSLMERDVVTVDIDDSIEKVESVMNSHDVTYVPVIDEGGAIFGIITARDLLHFHSLKKNPKSVRGWEICTHRPVEVEAQVSVIEAAKLMVDRKIHHLLVTEKGALIGIVSSFDLVEKFMLKGQKTKQESARRQSSSGH